MGVTVGRSQLERWRSFGLLPGHERHSLGRGRGSASAFDPSVAYIARAIAVRAGRATPIQETTLRLLMECPELELSEAAVKSSLCWYVDKKMRSGPRKAVDSVARLGAGASEDAAEDAAALALAEHFRRLRPETRKAIRAFLPDRESFSMGAIMGSQSVGDDLLLESIGSADPAADDPVLQALRVAIQKGTARDSQEPTVVPSPPYRPDYQKERIAAVSLAAIHESRDLLLDTATRVRLLKILCDLAPEDETVRVATGLIESSIVTRAIYQMHSGDLRSDYALSWRTDTKNLIMLLVLEQAPQMYRFVREQLDEIFAPQLDRLLALVHARLPPD